MSVLHANLLMYICLQNNRNDYKQISDKLSHSNLTNLEEYVHMQLLPVRMICMGVQQKILFVLACYIFFGNELEVAASPQTPIIRTCVIFLVEYCIFMKIELR